MELSDWNIATRLLIPSKGPSQQGGIYLTSYATSGQWYQVGGINIPNLPPPGKWIDLDWTKIPNFPIDAVALDVSGILIISDGANSQDTSIGVSFQAPGAGIPPVGHYVMQAEASLPSGGARSNAFAQIPVVNGHSQMSWQRGNSTGEWPTSPLGAQWPAGASYGFNLSIQGIWLP